MLISHNKEFGRGKQFFISEIGEGAKSGFLVLA
jgi:hypothetical protein